MFGNQSVCQWKLNFRGKLVKIWVRLRQNLVLSLYQNLGFCTIILCNVKLMCLEINLCSNASVFFFREKLVRFWGLCLCWNLVFTSAGIWFLRLPESSSYVCRNLVLTFAGIWFLRPPESGSCAILFLFGSVYE